MKSEKAQYLSLEAAQNTFLGFLCYHCNIPCTPHYPYSPILSTLDSLHLRGIKPDLSFLYKVLNSHNIYCPEFLSLL